MNVGDFDINYPAQFVHALTIIHTDLVWIFIVIVIYVINDLFVTHRTENKND